MFAKIMICTDGSKNALDATHAGGLIAQKFGSEVILLNVFDPSSVPTSYIGPPGAEWGMATDLASYTEGIRCAVERDTGKVLDDIGVRYTNKRELGHPVERIIAAAKDEKVDLIVMGRRGMSRFQSFLMGSVSDGVLHHAHCPVLIFQ